MIAVASPAAPARTSLLASICVIPLPVAASQYTEACALPRLSARRKTKKCKSCRDGGRLIEPAYGSSLSKQLDGGAKFFEHVCKSEGGAACRRLSRSHTPPIAFGGSQGNVFS